MRIRFALAEAISGFGAFYGGLLRVCWAPHTFGVEEVVDSNPSRMNEMGCMYWVAHRGCILGVIVTVIRAIKGSYMECYD